MMLSVIICSHNSREDYLTRVLSALQGQSLPASEWELIVVDNASEPPIAGRFDISWHPRGRHVREMELGLTPARLRGIAEAKSELLVFVDDDNILDPGYLEEALRIGRDYPFLGAWGGTIRPEFEQEPPEWTRPHWVSLAIREFNAPRWSNYPGDWQSQPCGAGLCVRRTVAETYASAVKEDSMRLLLGRKGSALLSSEDTDLVLTCAEHGYGWGAFPSLLVTHLIPSSRLTEEYLLRLTEAIYTSITALDLRRGGTPPRPSAKWRRLLRQLITFVRYGARAGRFERARYRGLLAGLRLANEGPRSSAMYA